MDRNLIINILDKKTEISTGILTELVKMFLNGVGMDFNFKIYKHIVGTKISFAMCTNMNRDKIEQFSQYKSIFRYKTVIDNTEVPREKAYFINVDRLLKTLFEYEEVDLWKKIQKHI